jgi:hypothetical protein
MHRFWLFLTLSGVAAVASVPLLLLLLSALIAHYR